MESFDGKVAAITGAGSGIGRALAVALAGFGAHLALSDIDIDGLEETARLCAAAGRRVTTEGVDVADRSAVEAWADLVVAQHGGVDLVINNAGVAVAAPVASMSYDDLEWLMGINFWGVVYGTKAFLPHLQSTGGGHIVNVSSVFGLISVPTQSAYNAAKFAVRGFTDALRMELAIEPCGVSCTTVHPGGIKTNIARNARVDGELASQVGGDAAARRGFDRLALTTPDRAAIQILEAVRRNRRRVLVGPDAKVIDLLSRLPAGLYQGILIGGARRAQARRRRAAR